MGVSQEDINRINELARKSKREGLTAEEKDEQQKLRQKYIQAIRANIRSQLDQISIVEPDGTITDLGKKHSKYDS